jgi:hypothetical protein
MADRTFGGQILGAILRSLGDTCLTITHARRDLVHYGSKLLINGAPGHIERDGGTSRFGLLLAVRELDTRWAKSRKLL